MATRSRPAKPPRPPATTPRRTLRTAVRKREGAANTSDIFNWRVGEVVIGTPRARRAERQAELA